MGPITQIDLITTIGSADMVAAGMADEDTTIVVEGEATSVTVVVEAVIMAEAVVVAEVVGVAAEAVVVVAADVVKKAEYRREQSLQSWRYFFL